MRSHDYWVYILTNKSCSTLYIGVTNDLECRVAEHKLGEVLGFTQRYQLKRLVWFEHFRDIDEAIAIAAGQAWKKWSVILRSAQDNNF